MDKKTTVSTATRAICALNSGGYCDCIGESRGCKVGRGEPPEASRCKMTDEALPLTAEYHMALAALDAARASQPPVTDVERLSADIGEIVERLRAELDHCSKHHYANVYVGQDDLRALLAALGDISTK